MMNSIIQRLIPKVIIENLRMKLGVPNQTSSFLRLKKLGFNPNRVIDIGAYEGHWASNFQQIFPYAHILMIEGQKNKESILIERLKKIPNSCLKIALLGAEKKIVDFNIYESASSIFKEDNETNAKVETIQLSLLDEVGLELGFHTADLIKLDTQGSELEILKGGENLLNAAQVVLIEVSLLGIYKEAPLVHDVINFMKERGFVLYDICSIMRRPFDKALFQSDFMFVKENHSLISSTRWA